MKKAFLINIIIIPTLLLISACGSNDKENVINESIEEKEIVQEKKTEVKQTVKKVESEQQENENVMMAQSILAPLGLAEGVGLYKYDSGEIIWEKKYGNNNHGIAYSNEKVYLPNMSEKKVEILNVKDGSKIGELTTEATTHHASQSEKMNEVYITSNNGKIIIIDGINNKMKDNLEVAGSPYLVLADEENNNLYVTSRNPDVIELFSLDTKDKVAEFPLPAKPSHINVNKNIIAVTSAGANKVSLFDVSSLEALETFNVGAGAHGVGINANYVLVANGGDKTLSLINRTTAEIEEIEVSIMPNHIGVQEEQFLVTDEEGPHIYHFNLEMKELKPIVRTNGPAHQFVLFNHNIEFIPSESELQEVESLGEEDHESHHG